MNELWGRPLVTVVLISVIAVMLWPVLGAASALGTYAALLLALLFHHLRNLSRLHNWLEAASPQSLPDGSGAWEEIFSGLSRLMRRKTQIETRLSATLARFQRAGAALPEGVIVLDEHGRIQWCNPRAENLFGLDIRRDQYQQITTLIRNPQFVEYLEQGSFNEPLTLRISRSDGEVVLSIQLVPYGGSDKLLLSRDITHWDRLETTRRDFVANVSHELRTPLTVLSGFLETLADMRKPDPDMTRRSITLMAEQTARMHHLVEDLLTLSRLESTQNRPHEEAVDVAELIQGLQRDGMALSGGRHRIQVSASNRNGLLGSVDELRSAFGNLVSNAVRYTPEGGTIEIGWTVREDGCPVFFVRDSGIGIEPQHLPRLTERFYRIDRSRSRSTGGTGLGLAIVKHVLSRHQGHLEIQSEVGKGSTFSAVFPPTRSHAVEKSVRDTAPEQAD
ncbi:MAG: phosphate regulon sensor histidine kinase PhoR [Burkholderiales bacterium]|nr:phosphate regulon sensor histidine kinase PhoR [Burkholderiales bacterium]